jgi:hypothetical protein
VVQIGVTSLRGVFNSLKVVHAHATGMSPDSGSAEAGACAGAPPRLERGYESLYECESSLLTVTSARAAAGGHEAHGTEPEPRGGIHAAGAPTDARDAAQGESGRSNVELAETEAAEEEAAGPHEPPSSSVAAPPPARDPADQGHEYRSQSEDGTLGVILLVDTAGTLAEAPSLCEPAGNEKVTRWLSQSEVYVGGGPVCHMSADEVQSSDSVPEFWPARETPSCTHSARSGDDLQAAAATGAAGAASRPPLENCMDTTDSAWQGQQGNSAYISPDDPGWPWGVENKGHYPWKVACGMACAAWLLSYCE